MKKITLLSLLMVSGFAFAQDDCASAVTAVEGTNSVSTFGTLPDTDCSGYDGTPNQALPNAATWFSYTPTASAYIVLNSGLDVNEGLDTALTIYTGACDALECFGFSDDIDLQNGNYLTTAGFYAEAGVTYYIVWDDRWDDTPFDFTLEVIVPDCTAGLPFTEDFESPADFAGCYQTFDIDGNGAAFIQQSLDFDEDGIDETFATGGVATEDDANDWTFSPAIAMVPNGTYSVSIAYNAADSAALGDGNEAFELVWADAPNPDAENQTVVGTYTDIVQNGDFAELEANATVSESDPFTPAAAGNYYLGIHVNSIVGGGFLLIFNYTVTEVLGTQDVARNVFSTYPNPAKSMLTLVQNESIDSYDVYDMLGNKVMSAKVNATSVNVNVSGLTTGTYVVKANSASGTKVSKFVKS